MSTVKIVALCLASMVLGLIIAGTIGLKLYYSQMQHSLAADIATHSKFLEIIENNQFDLYVASICQNIPTSLEILDIYEKQLFSVDLKDMGDDFMLSTEEKVHQQLSDKGICSTFFRQSNLKPLAQ